MNPITIIIHTYNEAAQIKECILSAKLLSNDIIIIDMESRDDTQKIAKREGASVYSFSSSRYVEPAREFGIQKSKGEWVCIVDADERITKKLAAEIQESIPATPYTYFRVPRKNIFGKRRWLKHGGWWPDEQIRLIHKEDFKSWPTHIHSTPHIQGTEGSLHEPLLHFFHSDLTTMVNKTGVYESIEAEMLYQAKRNVYTATFFRKYFGELFRRLVRNFGFLDGSYGIIESIYQAYSKTVTWILLFEKQHVV